MQAASCGLCNLGNGLALGGIVIPALQKRHVRTVAPGCRQQLVQPLPDRRGIQLGEEGLGAPLHLQGSFGLLPVPLPLMGKGHGGPHGQIAHHKIHHCFSTTVEQLQHGGGRWIQHGAGSCQGHYKKAAAAVGAGQETRQLLGQRLGAHGAHLPLLQQDLCAVDGLRKGQGLLLVHGSHWHVSPRGPRAQTPHKMPQDE